jgi:CubicO group peptidase (beta-lactamase class C family)
MRTLLAICCLLVPLAVRAQTNDARLSEWDQQLTKLRREHQLPGLAAAVVIDHKPAWSKGYGFADADAEVAVTPDTPFWIASVTKTFIGLLFLQLEAEGKISLDDRIADVPDWADFCEWFSTSGIIFGRDIRCDEPITIRNILNHTSNGEPGTRFFYNPFLYSRLSRYIEFKLGGSVDDVEGRHNTMAQLVESHILKPAGMSRTMASQWQREKALVFFDMASGFGVDEEGEIIPRPRPERELAGGAGIVATVDDLAKYDVALDTNVLGDKKLMAKLFTPARSKDGKTLPYAFGWYVQEYRGERLLWHSGWDEEAGYSALFLKIPDRALTLILLANGEGLWWENPLDGAAVERSPFAATFLDLFVFQGAATNKK